MGHRTVVSVTTTEVLSGFGSGFGRAEIVGFGYDGWFESSFELGVTLREFQERRERGRCGAVWGHTPLILRFTEWRNPLVPCCGRRAHVLRAL